MEQLLIALDVGPQSQKSIAYVNRILQGAVHIKITLLHVLPMASPDRLKPFEVKRIERLHEQLPHLSGFFWAPEDEARMNDTFQQARDLLLEGGFSREQIAQRFAVQFAAVAQVILDEARLLQCETIVLGRRALGRVQEFFQGSVSTAVAKMGKDISVWVVGD
jgi:nucleotide-binding universal stress UspA family protein